MSTSKSKKRRNEKRAHSESLKYQGLEKREMFAVAWLNTYGAMLWIQANDSATSVELKTSGATLKVHDHSTNRVWNYNRSAIEHVRFAGGKGNDRFVNNAYDMPTSASGGAGNDYLEGFNKTDIFFGGDGIDTLIGFDGDDRLHGEEDNDFLYGGSGNDLLYGGGGYDKIYGQSGDDGLFGGVGHQDLLNGGLGNDRFLNTQSLKWQSYYSSEWNRWRGKKSWISYTVSENIVDLNSNDAVINFNNSPAMTSSLVGFGNINFSAGAWTDGEIETVDVALNNLHHHVGNTRLLKTANNQIVTFLRVGEQLNHTDKASIGGWNGGDTIALTDLTMKNNWDSSGLYTTVYHELGHNWDDPSENGYASSFRAISQWRTGDAWGYTASLAEGDNWYYRDSSFNFARQTDTHLGGSYSTWNPQEDYATTWETYFNDQYHGTNLGNNVVSAKFANLDRFFAAMRA